MVGGIHGVYTWFVKDINIDQIEREVKTWKPEKRRLLLSRLMEHYQKDFRTSVDADDIESLGWMALAQSSLGFWDNREDAVYDRV